ncbi:MAG: VOC family protein [Actinomycetota bacterium]|nr:VOC family protein [Candidatus Dormibacteraeota bacterium]MDQ6946543.1 VOC family protein [Actinomycetota bacterium]
MSEVQIGGPGFIAITVSDPARSAAFYETHLGAVRDTFDFGSSPGVAFVGPPIPFTVRPPRPGEPGPAGDASSIALWWKASDAQAVYERVKEAGVPIVQEPFDGPFGRTFILSDPDGYKVTVYESDRPLFWPPKS